MKTKNVKVRLKDVKAGVTMYVAHPVYGIEKHFVLGLPYQNSNIGLFVKVKTSHAENFEKGNYVNSRSLCDMGITSLYNDRRTFFKLKHAQEWMNKWSKQEGFIRRQAEHEEWCEAMDWMDEHFFEEDDYAGNEEFV